MMSRTVNEVQTLKSHRSDVTSCDFSKNNLLLTGSSDKTVRLWSWKPGLGFVEEDVSPLTEHKYGVTCVTFSPQGTMFASSSIDGSTVLWSTKTANKIYKFSQVNGDPVRVCRFNNDSCTMATGGDNGIVCVWDILHRTLLRMIQHHEEAVNCLSFTPDSTYLMTACNHGVLKLYFLSDICSTQDNVSALVSVNDSHDMGVMSCDFSNKIQTDPLDSLSSVFLLATSGNDQCIRLWKVYCKTVDKKQFSKIELDHEASDSHSSSITCVRFNWSGDMLCSSSLDRIIKLWDSQLNCHQSFGGHSRYVNCVHFSKNCDLLCSGSNDKSVKIWDISGGNLNLDSELSKPCKMLSHFGRGDLEGISILNDEDVVLSQETQSDNEMTLIQNLESFHSAAVNCVEFNSDGLLATCSRTVRIFKPQEDNNLFYEEMVECSPFATHEYQVNGVSFISPSILATCSLDGSIFLWNVGEDHGCLLRSLASQQMAGVKAVKATPDGKLLLSAHDDGIVSLWSLDSSIVSPIVRYQEHGAAATCCSVSPDGLLIATASSNGDLKIFFSPQSGKPFSTIAAFSSDCTHDLGVLSMDFATKTEDFPFNIPSNLTCHLLATSGSDCLAKIWKISLSKDYQTKFKSSEHKEQKPFWLMNSKPEKLEKMLCDEWRIYSGHGSNVTCVRFPTNRSDIICTTSIDKQARIWSVMSLQCLFVLEHSSFVTSCSFSSRNGLLASACISGEICIWKMPKHLLSDDETEKFIRSTSKNPLAWTSEEVVQWLKEVGDNMEASTLRRIIVNIISNDVTGRMVLKTPQHKLIELLALDESNQSILEEVFWLRFATSNISHNPICDPPHHLLCPITHGLMTQPVKCADGFTYEKSAIYEWFLGEGKHVSPMTNQPLLNNLLTPNRELRKEIKNFIQNQEPF